MSVANHTRGVIAAGAARIAYEIAGAGPSFIMIHAGVADSRQWTNEFAYFADRYRVVRYDLRGFGLSDPVDEEYTNLGDLVTVVEALQLSRPLILMGCSMGGGLALDFALAYPQHVQALIMVGSGPSGLELDVPTPAAFDEAEQAYLAGDLDRLAELETQIWFDGMGRSPEQVDGAMRELAYAMNRHALGLQARGLGKRLSDTAQPAVARLGELRVPLLVIVGAHDISYIQAAADYLEATVPTARKVVMDDAAHLPNLDHPAVFRGHVATFLDELG